MFQIVIRPKSNYTPNKVETIISKFGGISYQSVYKNSSSWRIKFPSTKLVNVILKNLDIQLSE